MVPPGLAASSEEEKVPKVELVDVSLKKCEPAVRLEPDIKPLEGLFECILCSESYCKQEDLAMHEQTVHSLYACGVCFKVYTSGKWLANHKRDTVCGIRGGAVSVLKKPSSSAQPQSVGNCEGAGRVDPVARTLFMCDKCPKTYKSEKALVKHTSNVHSDVALETAECGVEVAELRFQQGAAGLLRVSCDLCPKTYSSVSNLKKHKCKEHPAFCDVCNKVCADEDQVHRHKQVAHTEIAKRRVQPKRSKRLANCSACHGGCLNERRVALPKCEVHRAPMTEGHRSVASSGPTEIIASAFSCHECSRGFESDVKLKRHQRADHPKQRLECKVCGKVVLGIDRLYRHQATHATERYECDVCRKVIVGLHRLHKHRRNVHGGEQRYRCKSCPKLFTTLDKLGQHNAAQHSTSRVQCDYCLKMFRCRETVRNHIAYLHKGKEPYLCQWCNVAFGDLVTRTNHERTVHKPDYWCHFCLKNFFDAGALYEHVQFICGAIY